MRGMVVCITSQEATQRAIACYGSTVGISVAQNLFGGGEEQKRDNAGGIIPLSVL